ncbi:hypothetical protein FPOAC2_00277 [Fusarium poae]
MLQHFQSGRYCSCVWPLDIDTLFVKAKMNRDSRCLLDPMARNIINYSNCKENLHLIFLSRLLILSLPGMRHVAPIIRAILFNEQRDSPVYSAAHKLNSIFNALFKTMRDVF